MDFVLVGYREEQKDLTNSSICKRCKGAKCCKNSGCAYSPDDFHPLALNLQYLIAFINRGTTSIAHLSIKNQDGAIDANTTKFSIKTIEVGISMQKLEKGEGLLYLRTRDIGYPVVDVIRNPNDGKIKRGCCLLREDGCSLTFQKRPKEGRMTIPNSYIECKTIYTAHSAAYDWWPYQKLLYELYLQFNKEITL